jgi:hypothetical protein
MQATTADPHAKPLSSVFRLDVARSQFTVVNGDDLKFLAAASVRWWTDSPYGHTGLSNRVVEGPGL